MIGLPVIATSDWLASKYGSLKSTASARSGRIEIWAMCQSNGLSPGRERLLEHRVGDPVDLLGREAERRRDRVGDRRLVALAGVGIAQLPAGAALGLAGVLGRPGRPTTRGRRPGCPC